MPRGYFHKVVEKIEKKNGKIIQVDKIKDILKKILKDNYKDQKVYKIIYRLKNRGYLISLKKDLFYAKQPDQEVFLEEIVDNFYRKILYKHCHKYVKTKRYISGLKALELDMSDYNPPEKIDVVNPKKTAREVVLDERMVYFRQRKSKGQDLYKDLRKFTKKIQINSKNFKVAELELAILESLYNPDIFSQGYANKMIKRILRKKKNRLDLSKIKKILLLGKHHSSANRLYDIIKKIDKNIAQELKQTIQKYGFLT